MKKYILLMLILVSIILSVIIYFGYLNKVKIYEPLLIKIPHITIKDKNSIQFFGVSPLNKKCIIPYIDSLCAWNYYYAFHKTIEIIIPDTVFKKIDSIDLIIGKSRKLISSKSLKCIDSSSTSRKYLLLEQIKSDKSIFKMIFSIRYWQVVQRIILFSSVLIFLLLFVFNFKRIKKYSILFLKTLINKIIIIYKIIQKYITIAIKCLANSIIYILKNSSIFILNKYKSTLNHFRLLIKKIINFFLSMLGRWLKIVGVVFKSSLKYLRNQLPPATFYCFFLAFISGLVVLILFMFKIEYKFMGYFLIILLCIVLQAVVIIISNFLHIKSDKRNNISLSLMFLMIALILAEFILRFSGITYSNIEKINGGIYQSPYKTQEKGWYHIRTPNKSHELKTPEYNFIRNTNSLGLSDKEFSLVKSPDEYRILGLGDSFTEGDGANSDSTWMKILERSIRNKKNAEKFSFYNAGVCGSDPYFEYVLLRDKLIKYKPNLVIVSINGSDITDINIRGGMERFIANGTCEYRKPPYWEPIYIYSHIFRLATKISTYFRLGSTEFEREKALKLLIQTIPLFKTLSINNNFKLLIIIHPMKREINEKKYDDGFEAIAEACKKLNVECFDMLDYFNKIQKINSSNSEQYFWKSDGHHNAKGYSAFAHGIEWKLYQMEILNYKTN